MTAIVGKRLNQKAAPSVGGFGGKIEILAIYNKSKNGFFANVKVFSDAVTSQEFAPANDDGSLKRFSNIAALHSWVNGAFLDITELSVKIDDMADLSIKFTLPANPAAEVLRQKEKYQKLKTALVAGQAKLATEKASAAALGYDTSLAPAAQAAWAEILKREAVLAEHGVYYDAKILEFTV